MYSLKPFGIVSAVILAFNLVTTSAHAQSSNPAWLDNLEYEMAAKHNCKIAKYLTIQESELVGKTVYTARVKCLDGREFDADKTESDEEFDIRICKVFTC